MDFFRAQHDARRRTRLLVGLFLLSLVCLLTMANLILYFTLDTSIEPTFYIGISIAILLVVLFSSLFKALSLRQGGEAVAQMLDARLLASPSNNAEQRLLNIVEEMAIASGTPVPPVYVMEETAINAFAAGHSINDAVIGITRGAIDKLSRDELQGVIAHEFSHVLHGDMRLNLRLIAWLHGIMVLGIMGHFILRGAAASRRGNNNNAGIAIFGLGLLVLGASGSFFGGLIKAAVSRQREYLADASAVQYTRNPQGIAGALKRIAADTSSPVLANPAASQISHALFSEGVQLHFSSLFATHPPLEKRIRLLDPQWNGEYQSRPPDPPSVDKTTAQSGQQSTLTPLAVALAIARAGAPDDQDISEAHTIHSSLPAACTDSAHSPLGAAAIICLLLMQEELLRLRSDNAGDEDIGNLLSMRLSSEVSPAVLAEVKRIHPGILLMDVIHRLPLINICLGTLRQLSLRQYKSFRSILCNIIDSDPSPDLASWVVFQLTTHHLDKATGFRKPALLSARSKLVQSDRPLEVFFSLLAQCGHTHSSEAEPAFRAAVTQLGMPGLEFQPSGKFDPSDFGQAIEQLSGLENGDKQRLLNAMSACVYHDNKLTVAENELMKMASETLDWPLPAKIFR
ncbi:MAG: M48 family metallopeptidase [Pseudohongiella sp.]|nr:M48 family metallopeptidase [Pseudohongiella sp.]